MRIRPIVALLATVALFAGLAGLPQAGAQPAPVAQTLCAKKGAATIGSTSVPIWGYAAGPCSSAGAPSLPGPEIRVTEGQGLELTLEVDGLGPDAMTEPVSIVVPNVAGQPDTLGIGPGATRTYSLAASDLPPGAYLYESGVNSGVQVPMGLHGALVVDSTAAGTAYGPDSDTAFNVEAVLTLSEIDTDLNTLDDPNDFVHNDYAPEYLLIDGQLAPQILAVPGDEVLLRYLNAGLQPHVMAVLGVHQTVVGRDSRPVAAADRGAVVAELLTPGQLADTILTVPDAAPGTTLSLYDRNWRTSSSSSSAGGGSGGIVLPGAPLFVSFASGGAAGGVTFADEDVVTTDGSAFSVAFDGSAAGLPANADIDALDVVGTDHYLLSFDDGTGVAVPDVGTVDDSDIVEFDAGSFSLYLDGSDAGLTAPTEDIDAIEQVDAETLLISTNGSPTVPDVGDSADEDLLVFTSTSLGSDTAGSWALHSDGSAIELGDSGEEDLDATADSEDGTMLFSSVGAFAVTGVSGADEDVFEFSPSGAPPITAGTYTSTLSFDGSAAGLDANDVDAVAVCGDCAP